MGTNDIEISYEAEVKKHYQGQAKECGLDTVSTMPDMVVREMELKAILETLSYIQDSKELRILEIGCGNGTLLETLHKAGYKNVVGVDFLSEFVALAKSRNLGFEVHQADIKKLPFQNQEFDIVISERVIINLKDQDHQKIAFREIRRVMKKGGHFIMIEAFENALNNVNEARAELGLDHVPMAQQNRWFKNGELENYTQNLFERVVKINGNALTENNFLSSHYFLSRVYHDFLIKIRHSLPDKFQCKVRNAHITRFFSSVLPPYGDYAPVQYFCFVAS